MNGPLERFLRGDAALLCQSVDGRLTTQAARPAALLCGSFNPLHAGHERLAEVASGRLGQPVAYELSVVNVEKPALDAAEVRRRLRQFVGRREIWLTREPTFLGKSALFPGVVFVVGFDTAARVLDPRYYGESDEAMRAALTKLHECGCRFLVAGRVGAAGRFLTASDLKIPGEVGDLILGMTEGEFRADVSSTAIRANPPA